MSILNNYKHLFAVLLLAVFGLALAGCGGDDEVPETAEVLSEDEARERGYELDVGDGAEGGAEGGGGEDEGDG